MKDFFKKKWVRITASVMVVVGSVALLIGGVKVDDIKNITVVTGAAFVAVMGVISVIAAIASPGTLAKTEA